MRNAERCQGEREERRLTQKRTSEKGEQKANEIAEKTQAKKDDERMKKQGR